MLQTPHNCQPDSQYSYILPSNTCSKKYPSNQRTHSGFSNECQILDVITYLGDNKKTPPFQVLLAVHDLELDQDKGMGPWLSKKPSQTGRRVVGLSEINILEAEENKVLKEMGSKKTRNFQNDLPFKTSVISV